MGFISIYHFPHFSKKKKSVSAVPRSVADAESSGGGSRLQHKQLAPLLFYRYNVNITDDSMGRAWQQRAHADRGFSARYPARRMDSWIHYPWRRRDGRRSCYPRSIRSPSFLPAQKQELMKPLLRRRPHERNPLLISSLSFCLAPPKTKKEEAQYTSRPGIILCFANILAFFDSFLSYGSRKRNKRQHLVVAFAGSTPLLQAKYHLGLRSIS